MAKSKSFLDVLDMDTFAPPQMDELIFGRRNKELPPEVQEFTAIVKSIDLRNFLLPIQLRLEPSFTSFYYPVLAVGVAMLDRDSGVRDTLSCSRAMHEIYVKGNTDETYNRIRALILHCIAHEFHECFLANGGRIFDPHNPLLAPRDWRVENTLQRESPTTDPRVAQQLKQLKEEKIARNRKR